MVKQSVLWRAIETHYSIVPLAETSTCKNAKYQCNYCLQIYASNVTRMSLHLMKDCPAPVTAKQEIRNIYTKSETSSASHKHFKINARWAHVSKHYVKLNSESYRNCKKDKYMCVYCNNRYANNVTRMAQHVMECARCPCETKNEFYKLSKPKSSSILAGLPDTFDMSSLEEEDEKEDDTFLYAAGFENDDTIDPISSNSFDEELEPLEEKYDITEHLAKTEGIENIETSSCFRMGTREMDEEEIKNLMARACYTSSTPLNIFENTHWQKLFNIISPNLNLPTRSELSDKYLNKEYNNISKEVELKIKEARKLSIQLIGNNNKKLTSVVVILNTPEPVVYDILEAKSFRTSSNNKDNIINKIIKENSQHIFYPIIYKNCDNLELNTLFSNTTFPNTTFPKNHLSWYKCNKHVLNLLIKDLMELNIFKDVLIKYKLITEEINLDKTGIESNKINKPNKIKNKVKHWKQLYENLEKMLQTKPVLQKLVKTSKYHQIKSKNTILDENGFWMHVNLFVNLIKKIMKWMNKIKPDSCISLVVECYSDLKETFSKETNILDCLDKHRSLAISEVHKAASLLDPHYMGSNLSPDEVIDAIEFINILSKILPDVKADKIIYDIAAYRTKQGIWGKTFVWDSLIASEVPAIIWWQSMCSSTELCKIAVSVFSCPPVIVSIEKTHDSRKLKSETFRKIEYVRHNMRLLTIENLSQEHDLSDEGSESD